MPKASDPSVVNVGPLDGTEAIVVDNGTNAALKTTPADIKAYIVAYLTGATPETLDTFRELAAALGDDPNFAATTAAAIGGKISKSLATAAGQFLVSTGVGEWAVKTINEVKTLLGLGSAAYTDATAYASVTDARLTETGPELVAANGEPSTLNLNFGRWFEISATALAGGNAFSVALSNIPAAPSKIAVTLTLLTGANIPTVTWPTGVTAPTLAANKEYWFTLATRNNGATWRLFPAGEF